MKMHTRSKIRQLYTLRTAVLWNFTAQYLPKQFYFNSARLMRLFVQFVVDKYMYYMNIRHTQVSAVGQVFRKII